MTADELENLLRKWGRCYGERPPAEWEGEERPGVAVHALARGMEFAPGKRITLIRQRTNMDRGGQDRRRMMARDIPGLRMVPASYVDAIPCTETRSGRSEARDWPVPSDLVRVERAALDLHRIDTLRGLVLRVNYCTRGTHEDKAAVVTLKIGSSVKMRAYRESLAHAKGWIHARLAA